MQSITNIAFSLRAFAASRENYVQALRSPIFGMLAETPPFGGILNQLARFLLMVFSHKEHIERIYDENDWVMDTLGGLDAGAPVF